MITKTADQWKGREKRIEFLKMKARTPCQRHEKKGKEHVWDRLLPRLRNARSTRTF